MINTKEVFCCSQENHEGRCPLTRGIAPGPSRAIGPAPSNGNCLAYPANIFPLSQKKKAPLCKGSWPVGPEGLSSPLHKTRRNPLKRRCNFASWMRHWRPHHGPAAECRQPDAKHPGKTTKEAVREFILSTALFSFSLCPWFCFFSFLTHHAETTLFDTIV